MKNRQKEIEQEGAEGTEGNDTNHEGMKGTVQI